MCYNSAVIKVLILASNAPKLNYLVLSCLLSVCGFCPILIKKVWETGSFDSEGRCFAMLQNNGMLVVMAGDDPSVPGNVLWSSNQGVRFVCLL